MTGFVAESEPLGTGTAAPGFAFAQKTAGGNFLRTQFNGSTADTVEQQTGRQNFAHLDAPQAIHPCFCMQSDACTLMPWDQLWDLERHSILCLGRGARCDSSDFEAIYESFTLNVVCHRTQNQAGDYRLIRSLLSEEPVVTRARCWQHGRNRGKCWPLMMLSKGQPLKGVCSACTACIVQRLQTCCSLGGFGTQRCQTCTLTTNCSTGRRLGGRLWDPHLGRQPKPKLRDFCSTGC